MRAPRDPTLSGLYTMTAHLSKHDDKPVVEYVEQADEKAVPQAGFIVVRLLPLGLLEAPTNYSED